MFASSIRRITHKLPINRVPVNRSFVTETVVGAMGVGVVTVGGYIANYWKTVLPHQRIVVTGLGIKEAYIGQTKLLLPKPLHQWYVVNLGVHTLNFDVTTHQFKKNCSKIQMSQTDFWYI